MNKKIITRYFVLLAIVGVLFSCNKEYFTPTAETVQYSWSQYKSGTQVTPIFADNMAADSLMSGQYGFMVGNAVYAELSFNNTILVHNYTPRFFDDITVLGSVEGIQESFVLCHLDTLPGHTSIELELPFNNGTQYFNALSGKVIDLSGLKGATITMDLKVMATPNSDLEKLLNIRANWKITFHNFSPDGTHANWENGMTPRQARLFSGMWINFAQAMSDPEFEQMFVDSKQTGNDDTELTNEQKQDFWVKLLQYRTIKTGLIKSGVAAIGLGGPPGTFGAQEWVTSTYHVNKNRIDVCAHEFGHILGYNHTSSITYPNTDDLGEKFGFTHLAVSFFEKYITQGLYLVNENNISRPEDYAEQKSMEQNISRPTL